MQAGISLAALFIDGLVAEETGNTGATGNFATPEAVRVAMDITFASPGDPAVLDRGTAARGLREVIAAMAILAPAMQEKARAREVLALLVRKLGEARDGGCSGP